MFRHAPPPPEAPRLSRQQADQIAEDLRALKQVEDLLTQIDRDDVMAARKSLGEYIAARSPALATLGAVLKGPTYPQPMLERLGSAAYEGARVALHRERRAIAFRLAQFVEVQP